MIASTSIKGAALKIVCLLLFGLLSQASAAECGSELAASVAKSANMAEAGGKAGDVVSTACKPWPHDRKLLLTAHAFGTSTEDSKVLVVATVDAATGRVVSSYEAIVTEDAAVHFGDSSLAIDVAPYQLAPDVRAFGVRFNSDARGASCADGAWSDELTLFVVDGKALHPVLRGMPMSRLETRNGGFCEPGVTYDEARLSVGMAGAATRGYADLQVSARIARHAGDKQEPLKTERYTLRYDGEQYRAAPKGQPWWLLFSPLGQ